MLRYLKLCLFSFLLLILLSACAATRSNYVPPTVGLKSFRLIPSDSFVPKFEIGLNVLNPNRDSLNLEGIFYTINVENHRILAGVANDLPEIEGYGEADITLEATVDVISGAKLLQTLLISPQSSFDYSFKAKLDLGTFHPPITITEKGHFSPGSQE